MHNGKVDIARRAAQRAKAKQRQLEQFMQETHVSRSRASLAQPVWINVDAPITIGQAQVRPATPVPPPPPPVKPVLKKRVRGLNFNGTRCCGIHEVYGIASYRGANGAVENILDIVSYYDEYYQQMLASRSLRFNPDAITNIPFLIFHDNTKYDENGAGYNLAAYITANKLGTLTETTKELNPNSSNYIQCWVWRWDYKQLRKWRAELVYDEQQTGRVKGE